MVVLETRVRLCVTLESGYLAGLYRLPGCQWARSSNNMLENWVADVFDKLLTTSPRVEIEQALTLK